MNTFWGESLSKVGSSSSFTVCHDTGVPIRGKFSTISLVVRRHCEFYRKGLMSIPRKGSLIVEFWRPAMLCKGIRQVRLTSPEAEVVPHSYGYAEDERFSRDTKWTYYTLHNRSGYAEHKLIQCHPSSLIQQSFRYCCKDTRRKSGRSTAVPLAKNSPCLSQIAFVKYSPRKKIDEKLPLQAAEKSLDTTSQASRIEDWNRCSPK